MIRRISAATAAPTLTASLTAAQGVGMKKSITLEPVKQIADAAIASYAACKNPVAATVVDRAGMQCMSRRSAAAKPHTLPSREQKAYTLVSAKSTSQALMKGEQNHPSPAYLIHISGFSLLGGGAPIRADSEPIGVAGVPRRAFDEQCALAGLNRVCN